MILPALSRIIIEEEVAGSPMARAVRRNAPGVEVLEVPAARSDASLRALAAAEGKRVLVLRQFRGRAFKQCQGLKAEYACCNLHTLAEANGCAMECTYCILQYYLTTPHLSVFANLEDLLSEVDSAARRQPRRLLRVGTGELSDSLLLDPLTESTRELVPHVKQLGNVILELKTKTDNVERLLDLDHGERTVVSWSVSPAAVGAREELKTAPLADRLRAAARVARAGYPVGFHLDPLIAHDGWERSYSELVQQLFEAVEPGRVAWVSLGTLRFPAEMKPTIEARFPRSRILHGELLPASDGKLRYPRPLRVAMYRHLWGELERVFHAMPIPPTLYLCMEGPAVWQKVFGSQAPSNHELEVSFARSYAARFGGGELPLPDPSVLLASESGREASACGGSGGCGAFEGAPAAGLIPASEVRLLWPARPGAH